MRTPLCIANWKMHGTLAEARPLATGVRDGLRRLKEIDVVLCPPFTALAAVGEILAGSPLKLGAQNCHPEPSGAHTGEIAPPMLSELGCRYVIVGHSERRRELAESDEFINRKVRAVLAHGMTHAEIVKAYPELTIDDVKAIIQYAADALHNDVLIEVKTAGGAP